ncbi:MAG: hypothetical protein NC339_08870 [Muribaculaceae bacterium]|nr:hypothetical protein [Muribaculaceae bacterium]
MQTYFPYSHIISNICNTIKQSISKHTYTVEWQIFEKKTETTPKATTAAISELYY